MMGNPIPIEAIHFSPEVFVHLAWEGIPDFSLQKCLDNLNYQIKFFQQLDKFSQLSKVIGAGTCLEYGDKRGICFEHESINPNSYFSWAKQSLSKYLQLFFQTKDIDFIWFRIFYAYGPGQRAAALIPTIINDYSLGSKPNIKNPSAENDFIYIDDVVDAFVRAIESRDANGIFNLGSGTATAVATIDAIVRREIQAGYDSEVKYDVNGLASLASTALIHRVLDWSPQVNLTDGIRRTIAAAQDES
jgi:nucleoside-diphosphate-sugar epimerase